MPHSGGGAGSRSARACRRRTAPSCASWAASWKQIRDRAFASTAVRSDARQLGQVLVSECERQGARRFARLAARRPRHWADREPDVEAACLRQWLSPVPIFARRELANRCRHSIISRRRLPSACSTVTSIWCFVRLPAKVARGDLVISSEVTNRILDRIRKLSADVDDAAAGARLTPRESEVLELAAEGLPDKVIAQRLSIQVQTVKNHMQKILRKLGVRGRGEAAARIGRNRRRSLGP